MSVIVIYPDEIGQLQCVHGCRDAELGHMCTDDPVMQATGNQHVRCSPNDPCIDVIMHRTLDRDWHDCGGTTADEWIKQYVSQKAIEGDLALFEVGQ